MVLPVLPPIVPPVVDPPPPTDPPIDPLVAPRSDERVPVTSDALACIARAKAKNRVIPPNIFNFFIILLFIYSNRIILITLRLHYLYYAVDEPKILLKYRSRPDPRPLHMTYIGEARKFKN
jgi:hypothetical protein